MIRSDVVVLGAGIVGVCIAVHLQKRGRSVVLIDRRGPGEETSFGNSGIIQREAAVPYAFPQGWATLARYALNRSIDAAYHARALPSIARFLLRYRWHSRADRLDAIADRYAPLIAPCVGEHETLAAEAGALDLVRPTGWLKLFRSHREQELRLKEAESWHHRFGVTYVPLDAAALRRLEPHLDDRLIGALHWTEPATVPDPYALTLAYVDLFRRLGGRLAAGDAMTLAESPAGWQVSTEEGAVAAGAAVVALGPWSGRLAAHLGYDLPLAVKRGYHMHYAPRGAAVLNRPVFDTERGYLLAPMARGIRLTTGAEFALRDAAKTPAQLERAEPVARSLFPLGERLDPEPWMGARPCTPDMMPIIGPAPRHRGLWLAFGHAHHGLTLGPVTGRLIAEMVTGEKPFVDPAAFRADRF